MLPLAVKELILSNLEGKFHPFRVCSSIFLVIIILYTVSMLFLSLVHCASQRQGSCTKDK